MHILALVLYFGFVTAPTYTAPSQGNIPSAQLSGRVVEEGTGAPITSARIVLFPQPRNAPGPVPQTITDQDGRYAFEGVAPGRYRVDVQKSGILPPADPAKVPTVTLAAGQVIGDWNVSVQKGGAIAGRILDPYGEPLVDVTVRAVPRSGPGTVPSQTTVSGSLAAEIRAQGITVNDFNVLRSGGISTNDLGEFRVFGLAPGEYVIAASPQQRFGFQNISTDMPLLASTFYPGVSDASSAETIAVTAGETVLGVEFRLLTTPGFRISGVVVDQAGAPVAGAMVMLRGDPRSGIAIMGPVGQSSSDANGMFVLGNIPSGSYYATVIPIFASRTIGSNAVESSVISSVGEPAAGTVAVTVNDANIEDLRLVVQRQ